MAARQVTLLAKARGEAAGICRRKASRIWKAAALVRRVWKGSLAPLVEPARAGESWGVTGSVSGEVVRPAPCPNTSRVGFRPWNGAAPNGNERPETTAGVVAPTTSLLEVGDAACGYPAPPWKVSF